jgi:hypothetical protein
LANKGPSDVEDDFPVGHGQAVGKVEQLRHAFDKIGVPSPSVREKPPGVERID